MFHGLDEEIETSEGHLTSRERLVGVLGVAILSLLVFAGLYVGIVALE